MIWVQACCVEVFTNIPLFSQNVASVYKGKLGLMLSLPISYLNSCGLGSLGNTRLVFIHWKYAGLETFAGQSMLTQSKAWRREAVHVKKRSGPLRPQLRSWYRNQMYSYIGICGLESVSMKFFTIPGIFWDLSNYVYSVKHSYTTSFIKHSDPCTNTLGGV